MTQPSPYSAPPPRTRCARCGLVEVCGEREDEPVCSRCVLEMLDEIRRERDDLRAAYDAALKRIADDERDIAALNDFSAMGRERIEIFRGIIDTRDARIRELETEREATVERTRRDIYKNLLAGLGVDYEEDASAMTLLLKVNAEIERAVELREAARAAVEALNNPEGSQIVACGFCDGLATTFDNGGKTRCDVHPNGGEDLTYAPAWRRLCALAEGK